MRIFAEVPGEGCQTTVELSRMAIFSIFTGYFSETLEMRPALLCSNMQSVISFSMIPKCMTWNGYFAFCFRTSLALTVQLSKNNCVKTNTDRHILSGHKSLAGTLVSGNKVCVDIRSGSLERKC